EQRRLAGAVRAGQREPVAALELERDPVEQRVAGQLLAEVGGDQDCHGLQSRRGRPGIGSRHDQRPRGRRRDFLGARAGVRRVGLHERTGCYPHPSFWPAKLAWLAETEPETFRSARRFAAFGELVGVGETTMSLSMASSTGLLDLRARAWDQELLDFLGLDEARLPRVGDEGSVIDGVCSNLGAGCVGPSRAALMVGTSGALRLLREEPEPRPRPGLFLYVHTGSRVAEGGALSDGGNLHQWLDDTLARSEE